MCYRLSPRDDYKVALMVPVNTRSQRRSESLSHIARLTQLGCQQGSLRSSVTTTSTSLSYDYMFPPKYYIRNQMSNHKEFHGETEWQSPITLNFQLYSSLMDFCMQKLIDHVGDSQRMTSSKSY